MVVSLKSGSDSGRLDAMEARITRLEDDRSEIRSDLKLLLIGFAEIKGALKGMASAEALGDLKATVGELKGSVSDLRGTMASAEALADLKGTVAELKGTMASTQALAELKGTVGELRGTMASAEALADLKGTVAELRGTMASGAALAELKGRVDALPTMAKMNSAIGLATAMIVILNNWSLLKTWLVG